MAAISEGVVVITGVWARINHPVLFLIAPAGFILLDDLVVTSDMEWSEKIIRFYYQLVQQRKYLFRPKFARIKKHYLLTDGR